MCRAWGWDRSWIYSAEPPLCVCVCVCVRVCVWSCVCVFLRVRALWLAELQHGGGSALLGSRAEEGRRRGEEERGKSRIAAEPDEEQDCGRAGRHLGKVSKPLCRGGRGGGGWEGEGEEVGMKGNGGAGIVRFPSFRLVGVCLCVWEVKY